MRLHLFEFEDFEWFPQMIREGITDYLRFVTEKFKVYQPTAVMISDVINKTGFESIIDLCAGGGGGVESISKEINTITGKNIKVFLTDKYPNVDAFNHVVNNSNGSITFLTESVDALNVPAKLKGVRTMYSSFHHFKPADAKKILQNSVDNKMPILIFEAGERSILGLMGVLMTTPLVFLFATPFMKPFKLSRLFFTYIIPLMPIVTIWDGIVSMLRIYKPDEMLELTKEINADNFEWKAGKIKYNSLKITYMFGLPNDE
jgi:hypothetical protein